MVTPLPTKETNMEMGYCKEFKKPTKPEDVCSGFEWYKGKVDKYTKVEAIECRHCQDYRKIDPEKPLPKDIIGVTNTGSFNLTPEWLKKYEKER